MWNVAQRQSQLPLRSTPTFAKYLGNFDNYEEQILLCSESTEGSLRLKRNRSELDYYQPTKIAQDAVMVALADPASMISVAKFTGKRAGEDLPETSRMKARNKGGAKDGAKDGAPKDTPAGEPQATGKASSPAASSEGLSPALLAMLQAAKGGDPSA